MNSDLADVSIVAGKSFVASSGNKGGATKLDDGALSVAWDRPPSVRDASEFDKWAMELMGIAEHHNLTSYIGEPGGEMKALREWKRMMGI